MVLFKTLIDLLAYPLIYLLTLLMMLLKEISSETEGKSSVDAIKSAKSTVKEFKEALKED